MNESDPCVFCRHNLQVEKCEIDVLQYNLTFPNACENHKTRVAERIKIIASQPKPYVLKTGPVSKTVTKLFNPKVVSQPSYYDREPGEEG